MRRIADKLFGDDYQWSILAAGRHQMPICTMAATMGANVRVGLEDSPLYRPRASLPSPTPTRWPRSADDPRGPVARDRDAGGGARDAGAQGWRQGDVLTVRELALLLASKGAGLVLTGRRPEPLAETAQLVEAAGAQVRTVAGDVGDADHRRAALTEAERAFGGLDVLVNNAGNVAAGRLDSISEAEVRAMIEVNLVAPILLTRAALPLLRASGDGLVVNVASGIALVAMPFYGIYAAAKGGLSQFGEALRRELSGEGVRVMTAYPAATETAMMASSKSAASTAWCGKAPNPWRRRSSRAWKPMRSG
jgi:uncharacterized oxidoreductase